MKIEKILEVMDREFEGMKEVLLAESLGERGAEVEFHPFSNTATLMFEDEEMVTVDFDSDSVYLWSPFKNLLK